MAEENSEEFFVEEFWKLLDKLFVQITALK